MRQILILLLIMFSLIGCASDQTRLVQGKQDFIQEDYHQAFSTLQPLAVKGNADAQYAVAYMYYYGYGTPQNNELALKWMQSAAAQGQPAANQALKMIQSTEVNNEYVTNPVFSSLPPNYQTQ